MAHIGKLYPVHFRRDISLNKDSTNDRWARANSYQLYGVQGTWGGQLQPGDFMYSRAVDEQTFEVAKWMGEFTVLRGRSVRTVMEITLNGSPYFKLNLRVDDFTAGNLLSQNIFFDEFASYSQMNIFLGSATYPQPAILRSIGFNAGCSMLRVLWEQYNILELGW